MMRRALLCLAALGITPCAALHAQQVRVGDLTVNEGDVPVRLMGYGLVVGLDGTGDRVLGGFGARHTVQSVVNLLRNFDIEVPPEVLRTRNVAAVLVTAEASPYLRVGGRADVQVSSVGDAVSLRGGVLWATPLVSEAGGPALAVAQGGTLVSEGRSSRSAPAVETSARVPSGALIASDLPRRLSPGSRLLLKEPKLEMAVRIAAAVVGALGEGAALVEDPGAVSLKLPADQPAATALARIADLKIDAEQRARIIIDGRDGTVAVGGDIAVRSAVVSHGGITVNIGTAAAAETAPGEVRLRSGTTVQDVAGSLQLIGVPAPAIAAVFEALRAIGALTADVVVR